MRKIFLALFVTAALSVYAQVGTTLKEFLLAFPTAEKAEGMPPAFEENGYVSYNASKNGMDVFYSFKNGTAIAVETQGLLDTAYAGSMVITVLIERLGIPDKINKDIEQGWFIWDIQWDLPSDTVYRICLYQNTEEDYTSYQTMSYTKLFDADMRRLRQQ